MISSVLTSRASRLVAIAAFMLVLALPVASAHAAFGIGIGGGDSSFQWGVSFGDLPFGGGYSGNTIPGIGMLILDIINGVLVPLLFAIAFIVFLWGIYKYFIAGGDSDEGQKKGKQLILYGVIGFAVMVSLWGLVNVVANTFGLAGQVAPPIPLSF
ncbi:MAG TPA: hypothetical protein VF829_03485 [Candidatus Paceibacterota bacterium]